MAGIRNIVIFGATGNTGLCCVETAISQGYEVTVFVRNPDLLPESLTHQLKSVIIGDVLNQMDVDNAVQGQDGVVVALGTRNDLGYTTVMSEGTRNILDSMGKYGVRRISACLSVFLFWERAKVPECYHLVNEDHERMLNILKSSDREWIAVLPPHISNAPGKGNYNVEHGTEVGRVISKYDLGHFLVTCLSSDLHLYQMVGLADRPE